MSTAVGYAWLFTMPSGEPCVMLMNPPTWRSLTQCSICAYAAASVEVKLPWYVANKTCPIFSSTLIFRSVASTHSKAAGVRRRVLAAPDCFSAIAVFSADERLWLRAVSAIRTMIAAGITNRTPARPFLNCGSPGSRRMQSLYITHAHRVNNATAKAKFHNIIGVDAMKNLRFCRGSEWQARALRVAVCVALAGALCGTSSARAKKSGRPGRVQTGLDVLEAQKFAPLRNKHVGLITNHTGLDSQGRSTVDLLSHAAGVHLVALFSPEHGLAGRNDEKLASSKDAATGLPIFSLYGETMRPTDEMLRGIDALVFDVQDAGVRFYTYTTTMAYCMEEAAKRKIAFYVLDRPNPVGGNVVEGPMLDADKIAFTAYFPLPVRYGLTIGELAQFFNAENHINCDLHVIL